MNFTIDPRFDFARQQIAAINDENYTSVIDLFETACAEYADDIAFTCMGQDMTFGEIDEISENFPAFLRSNDWLKHGERVAVQLPNLLQYPIAAWGILRAGLVLVNTNPLYTEREFCRKDLTAYKVPKFIEFRNELPKSTVGKILRRELR